MSKNTLNQQTAINESPPHSTERGSDMNEEFKPDALPSGLVERKNKQDDHLNSATLANLTNFMIRRQLLVIENKRIKELLLEAEKELKASRHNFIDILDRVLASLRAHLAHLDELARVEILRRQRPENLPRMAERYVRHRVKRLFGSLKPRASTGMADKPVATGVQDPGWRLPTVRELDAWTAWFAENDPGAVKASRFRKDRIQVALVVSGGIGDFLKSTHLVGPLSDHFSADLTIIAAQRAAGELVAHNPYVRDTLVLVNRHVYDLADHLVHIPIFDLIVVWRYHVQYVVPRGSRIAGETIDSIESKSSSLRRTIDKYRILHSGYKLNLAFSREMTQLGLSAMKVSVETSGLPHRNLGQIPFFPGKQSLRIIISLLMKPYVTVHHGFDLLFLPPRTRNTDYSSTKNISVQQWRQIVSLIRKQGIDVIQLGIAEEEKIEGVSHYLNGQTSIEETGLLIKHSLCHIDTEGGLVHLANAVHTRCVVLFGPTPVEFFGYPQNINLEPLGCKACWFSTQNWLIECPRHTSGPECMTEHSAAGVAAAANKIIAEAEDLSAKLVLAETQSSPTPLAETVAKAQSFLSPDAANRTLLILDDLECDVRSELSDGLLDGSDVILCAANPPNLEPVDRVKGRIEYASLLNLPRASASIDAAIWVAREMEADVAPFALREIFRVLKPDGQLVLVTSGEFPGLDLGRSLLTARIAFDEDQMPSAPVYCCSLRKSAPARSGSPISTGSSVTPERRRKAAVDPTLALLEDENRRQITLLHERLVEQEKVMDEARAVVDRAVQRGFGGDGWIWISNLFAEGYPTKFFMRGWHGALDWVIWSRENKCLLMLPFDEEPPSGGQSLELQLHLALPHTSASNPTAIGVRINNGPVENFVLSTEDEFLTVRSSTDGSKFRGVALIEFHLGGEISAGESERLYGSRRMGVKRFRYRVLSS
jgi:SAM-dependent methyltransferase